MITYRDIADTEAMIEAAATHRHAVVIGGGLLGLEAANGLMRRGMDVTVVHLMPWLMERQLDQTAGADAAEVARGARLALPPRRADRRRWSATTAGPRRGGALQGRQRGSRPTSS